MYPQPARGSSGLSDGEARDLRKGNWKIESGGGGGGGLCKGSEGAAASGSARSGVEVQKGSVRGCCCCCCRRRIENSIVGIVDYTE